MSGEARILARFHPPAHQKAKTKREQSRHFRGRVTTGVSADLQLYRTAILSKLNWPERNRRFQSDLAALLAHLPLPIDYCHELTGTGLGYTGERETIEKRVSRALHEAEEAERDVGVRLFEYKRGGGQKKVPTRYFCSHINDAAAFLHQIVSTDQSAVPFQVKMDAHVDKAIAMLPAIKKPAATVPNPPPRFRTFKEPPQPDNGVGLSAYGVAAEQYAGDGHRVVPLYSAPQGICDCKHGSACKRPGKHPRLIRYLQCGSRDIQQIRKWWRRWPNAGIGLLTGTMIRPGFYFVAIDVDRRHFGHGLWYEIKRDLEIEEPETMKVVTKDGWQFYFLLKADSAPATFGVKKAVELKGRGNLVVTVPTLRSGHLYNYENDLPMMEATGTLAQWMLKQWQTRKQLIVADRHDWLTKVARRLAADRLLESEIFGTLVVRRDTCCHPTGASGRTITDEELQGLAGWAYRIEQRERQQGKNTSRGRVA